MLHYVYHDDNVDTWTKKKNRFDLSEKLYKARCYLKIIMIIIIAIMSHHKKQESQELRGKRRNSIRILVD